MSIYVSMKAGMSSKRGANAEPRPSPCDPCVEDVRLLLLFVQALASSAATSTAATSFAASAHKLRCIWSWCCAG